MRRSRPRSHPRGAVGRDDLVCGINPVRETLRAARESVRRLWTVRGVGAAEEIAALAGAAGIDVVITDQARLDDLTGGAHHQGIAAETAPFAYTPLGDVLARDARLLVALDGITDPQNLGAIIRSSEALGASAVVVPRDRAAPVTTAVVRAACGATAHLPIVQVVNLARSLGEMKARGFWIVALDLEGADGFSHLPALDRAVLLVGGEGGGLRRLVLESADFRVRIGMRGRVESLNAAVAAAIGVYEIGRTLFGSAGPPVRA